MGYRGNDVWEAGNEVYYDTQVESVLDKCGVEVDYDTDTHFVAYCPFHSNTDSPAFAVDKELGLFTCFNPSCMASGTLEELVRRLLHLNPFQAQRLIIKAKSDDVVPFADRLKAKFEEQGGFPDFPQEKHDELHELFWDSPAHDYMKGRRFEDETLEHFQIGYSPRKEVRYPGNPKVYVREQMVTVPMHDIQGKSIGLIGRSLVDKQFKNSKDLPKKQTAWNIHRAKREGEAVIITEASFDAMRVHQAGYPNVIALLGGHVTHWHLDQINRLFTKIIIATDFDKKIKKPNCRRCREANLKSCKGHRPGRDLGHSIIKGLPNKKILWAAYDDTSVYPSFPLEGVRDRPAKDIGDMTDDEIRRCLKNAVSRAEYLRWDIEDRVLPWE